MGLTKGQKLKVLTLTEKAMIIEKLKKGKRAADCAKEYKVSKSTITNIKHKEKEIMARVSQRFAGAGKMRTMKKAENPKTERMIYRWFLKQRARHLPVDGNILKLRAKFYFNKYECKDGGNFNASSGWLQKWKKRYSIRLLTISGEKLAADYEAVEPFKALLKEKICEMGLTTEQVYNVDETALFWKMLPKKTYVASTEKSAPGLKLAKQRITILVVTNAEGTNKIKPVVIGKSKSPRCLKNYQLPVEYKSSSKAWMTSFLFTDWFHNSFVPQVKKFSKEHNLPPRALLIIDNAPSHSVESELRTDDGDIITIFLPPNVTSLLQPMDQNAIIVLKMHYKASLLTAIVAQRKENLLDALKKINLRDAITFLAHSWEKMKPDIFQKCWKSLLGTNVQFDSEDDIPLAILRTEQTNNNQDPPLRLLLTEIDNQNYNQEDVEMWIRDDPISECESINDSEEELDDEVIDISDQNAVDIFNKAISWANSKNRPYADICVLQSMRQEALKVHLKELNKLQLNNFSLKRFYKPKNI